MHIYIDGDNSPGSRTAGAGALSKDDRLYVYYSSINQYYKATKNREKLTGEASCEVTFIETEKAGNSADFAIAIDAGITAFTAGEREVIVLISEDKHFSTIARYLRTVNPEVSVCVEKNIHDAVLRLKLYELRSLDALQGYLTELYGSDAGAAFFSCLENMFCEKAAEKRKMESNGIESRLLPVMDRIKEVLHI